MSFVSPSLLGASYFIRTLFNAHPWGCHYEVDAPSKQHTPTCLADFDMDTLTGFLPDQTPLERLPQQFEIWESALDTASNQLSLGEDESPEAIARRESSQRWRQRLRDAPVLSIASLRDDVRQLRRAHHVLAFLVHFFMHSIPPTSENEDLVVPASLAVPLVATSDILRIAPILTFADSVLWNWTIIDSDQPLSSENIRPLTLFTKGCDDEGESERNFYICCANIELRGVEALQIIADYQNRGSIDSTNAIEDIEESLHRLSSVVDELTTILKSVRATCDPHAFYFRIRPWFRGSDANGPDSPAWKYEGVDSSRRLELSGPSAGQSSTMHALDVFLDVDHQLAKPRLPAPSEQNVGADHSFMMRMRKYMPGKHQDFLQHLAAHRYPIREIARCTPALKTPYDSVVLALKRFRDQHMRIACLYVVTMSRSSPAIRSGCPMSAMMESVKREALRQPVRGTGGNELSRLLKASRDATTRAVLEGNIS